MIKHLKVAHRYRGLVRSLLGAAGALVVATVASAHSFGDDPLGSVFYRSYIEQRPECGLSSAYLQALMLAPTYYETGAGANHTPSPMTLGRSDVAAGLYSFGDTNTYQNAFWHPGVGMWQLDSSGLGANFAAYDRINADHSAGVAAATMADRYCNATGGEATKRGLAWGPWFACFGDDDGDGVTNCEDFFQEHYQGGQLVGVTPDQDVTNYGGMEARRCRYSWGGDFACWYVDPARAEGYDGWTAPRYGPSPLTAPFYVYRGDGGEYRHWLRDDTGYDRGIYAWRPLGSNARTSLSWVDSTILCDLTEARGDCGPVLGTSFEAESYLWKDSGSGHFWGQRTDRPYYSGIGFMQARPVDPHLNINTGYTTSSPELGYQINFPSYGTYYVWIRGWGENGKEDSVHAGIDELGPASADRIGCSHWKNGYWAWCNATLDGHRATIDVTSRGVHTFHLWMRENGFRVDQIMLTRDPNYNPATPSIGPFEAESYDSVSAGSGVGSQHTWQLQSSVGGYLGTGYMQALPNSGLSINTGYTTQSPELEYALNFPSAGWYYVWVRGYGENGNEDSVHAGIDGTGPSTADRMSGCWNPAGWHWCNMTMDDDHSPAKIWVPSAGMHTFHLWMREDGFRADQIFLTMDPDYNP